ncbi:MAG: hypothetical protein IT422_14980 [Pirellulaceae bacterium]|nr:hypothetical protein [Pirellulaceae bacterium]
MNRTFTKFILLSLVLGSGPFLLPQCAMAQDVATTATTSANECDAAMVSSLAMEARQKGDAVRGAVVFASARLACMSCHRVGQVGGAVGPDLSALAKDKTLDNIVESVLWPQREVKPEYFSWQILTTEGSILSGYKVSESDQAGGAGQNADSSSTVVLRELANGQLIHLAAEDIDQEMAAGSVMPAGLTASMTRQQQLDLFRFLDSLGREGKPLSSAVEYVLAHAESHGPADFPVTSPPLDPQRWPNASHYVNRDRIYDYYTKQAEYFRQLPHLPILLPAAPDMDGGNYGHWGNQSDAVWTDGRWNDSDWGMVQAGVFHAGGLTVSRGVCVRLGEQRELNVCFNPDTLHYDALWKDGFVSVSPVRHGFLNGLLMEGTLLPVPEQAPIHEPFQYHGYYRYGERIVFSYRIGEVEYLDAPWAVDGQWVREVAPVDRHSLREALTGGHARWPQELTTRITPGQQRPLAIDTIELPTDNPWRAQLFCSGHDFLADGSALVCTMQGDVWHVSGLDSGQSEPGVARWRRFASGLHFPLGLVVADGRIYVQCRDQVTRLTDINGDGEADFYECFSNAFETSPAGHDYICGLERDAQGNFYTASGNQGLLRIAADGQSVEVLATGFRNPDGLGLLPNGDVSVPCSEGEWTPASMICLVRPESSLAASNAGVKGESTPPHFGYGGPRNGQPPELPLAYLPRYLDNSSGGQSVVPDDTWGALSGKLLHLSFGAGTWFTVLQDEVDGQVQGAVAPMTGDFMSGVHRGRFSPRDKQLYVSGMQGWGSYTPDDGCFQRVRMTDEVFQMISEFHVHENGVRLTFTQPIDAEIASDLSQHFAQVWNYRYSGGYGSVELSPSHPSVAGHDPLRICGAHILDDGRSLFLELPELQPVSQLHLRLHVNADDAYPVCNPAGNGHDLFITVHRMDRPFEGFPNYTPMEKTIAAHPILSDMALATLRVPNPWRAAIDGARPIELRTGKNLTYETPEIRVGAGEPIKLGLINPDVVPHNWVLVKPGALAQVGELANQLISNPEAFARHYIPESDLVICYTDIADPGSQQTISFRAPAEPGRYPFLCTFPGHWMVMNGVMIVE